MILFKGISLVFLYTVFSNRVCLKILFSPTIPAQRTIGYLFDTVKNKGTCTFFDVC